MVPKMTPLTRRLHQMAKRHHLTCALGRALAMTNRHYNDGWCSTSLRWDGSKRDELAYMRRMSLARAKRWLLHWSNGGSLRRLGVSREEQLRQRRVRDAEIRTLIRSWMERPDDNN